MEQHYTDKEFCRAFKINRSTSAEWREQGIVGYLKLPNGQIRYSQSHIDALKKFQHDVSPAFQDREHPIKRRVVDISVAKRRHNRSVAQDA
jgi:hypothetical protein